MPAHAKNQFFDEDHRTRLINDLRIHGHRLDNRERDILRLRAALQDGHHHTYQELGERYDLTANRIRQIEKAALTKLHAPTVPDTVHTGGLTETDLTFEQTRVTGQIIPLLTPGAAPSPAQARAALLDLVTPTGDRLRQLLASWLATVESPHTREAYLRDISQYFDYCIERDLDPLTVRIQEFNLYREHLARLTQPSGKRYALSTRNRKVAAVSSFYHHLVDVEAVDRSPVTRKARFNHKPDPPDHALTVAETVILLDDAASGHRTIGGDCAALIVAFLFIMGLRVSEVTSLELDRLVEVKRNGKTMRTISFTVKGNKQHVRAIADEMYEDYVLPYLARRPQSASAEDSFALLLDVNGKRITRKRIYDLVRRTHHRGLISHKVSPHWGRHTFDLRAEEAGFTIEQRQRAHGHASIVTTQGYGRTRNNVLHDPSHAIAAVIHLSRTSQPEPDDIPSRQQGETSDEYRRRPA